MLKKLLKIILLLLVAIGAIYLILCATGEKRTNVTISKDIKATPETIWPLISDFANTNKWSPWSKKDPNMTTTLTPNTSGVGAKMTWSSNHEDVGKGSQEIIESIPNQKAVSKLIFDGWEGSSSSGILLEPKGDATKVTWNLSDDQDVPFMLRGMMKLMMMSGAIEKDFTEGLQNLSDYIDKNPAPAPMQDALSAPLQDSTKK